MFYRFYGFICQFFYLDRCQMENDLFLEMLEVYINSILYLREIYPAAIFRRRRVYSTTAYISIFPPLNDYLVKVLKTAQELKAANKLFEVELIIFQRECELFGTPEDEDILEKYIFRVECVDNPDNKKDELDVFIFKFEEELRRGLIELNQKVKSLKRLSDNCQFRIHLETTQNAFVDLVSKDNSKSEVSHVRNKSMMISMIMSFFLLNVVFI